MKKLIDTEDNYRIVVYGCGGHARSIVNTICETNKRENILLVDDNAQIDEIILGCKVVCKYNLKDNDVFIIAIGNNKKRMELYQRLNDTCKNYCVSVVSTYANIGLDGEIGRGTFVAPFAFIGPQAKVGNDTIINTGSIIEHEAMIGDHTHIAPHVTICGRSAIGNNVFCGAGSTVIDRISICNNVVIGAGAVVTKDIVEAGIYVGIPAQRIG